MNSIMTINIDEICLKKIIADLGMDEGSTLSDVVDATRAIKRDYDDAEKALNSAKDFFKASGDIGDSFDGEFSNIKLVGRAATSVDPSSLKDKLILLNREEEFLGLVSVKIKYARDKLGTTLFNAIADIVPDASITVKIKKR